MDIPTIFYNNGSPVQAGYTKWEDHAGVGEFGIQASDIELTGTVTDIIFEFPHGCRRIRLPGRPNGTVHFRTGGIDPLEPCNQGVMQKTAQLATTA